jgi:hypothetical protein
MRALQLLASSKAHSRHSSLKNFEIMRAKFQHAPPIAFLQTATSCPDSCKTWFGNYPKSCLEASQKFAEQFSGLFGNIDLDLEDVDYEEDVCADFFKAGGFGQGESSSSPPPEEEPTEEAEEEAETETSATPTATASPAPTSTTPTTATPAPTTTNGASPRSLMSVVVAGMAMGLVMM